VIYRTLHYLNITYSHTHYEMLFQTNLKAAHSVSVYFKNQLKHFYFLFYGRSITVNVPI